MTSQSQEAGPEAYLLHWRQPSPTGPRRDCLAVEELGQRLRSAWPPHLDRIVR